MAVLKCKMCGGNLILTEGSNIAECEYCGSLQTVPSADNEKKINLFARANRLRAGNEFDKAAAVYESIVTDFPEEAEAYWGLILCNYGIEYVDDPSTGKKIPTCHRSSFDSLMDDPNFELVMEYADPIARRVYRDEAKQIEALRKSIIEVSSKEEPYDIFISYKESDKDGQRTLDSVLAQDIYDMLTENGYRVFFSRISLEDKLGVEFEPYIFAALNSAKIMLVVGTDYEYFNAVWVKNEWSRFLQLITRGEKKTLIPCFKNIDAYDMPKEFAKLQAQDLGKVGALQDLLRGVSKILPKRTGIPNGAADQTAPLLRRAFLSLEDGEWAKADAFCEQMLNTDPENAQAYLGKLMAELHVSGMETLANSEKPLDTNKNYQKAIRFGDPNLVSTLKEINKQIVEHSHYLTNPFDDSSVSIQQALTNIQKNSIVNFGKYMSEANRTTRPIKWQVLDIIGNKALIITLQGIDVAPFNKSISNVTWETCTLRNYMNKEMLNEMFNEAERKMLIRTSINNTGNRKNGVEGGNTTEDLLFLLSIDEVKEYWFTDSARCLKPSDYAISRGAFVDILTENTWWWLRSPGCNANNAAYVDSNGSIYENGISHQSEKGVIRPACWITLSNYRT